MDQLQTKFQTLAPDIQQISSRLSPCRQLVLWLQTGNKDLFSQVLPSAKDQELKQIICTDRWATRGWAVLSVVRVKGWQFLIAALQKDKLSKAVQSLAQQIYQQPEEVKRKVCQDCKVKVLREQLCVRLGVSLLMPRLRMPGGRGPRRWVYIMALLTALLGLVLWLRRRVPKALTR